MKKPTNKAYGFLSGYYEDLAAADGYAEWAEYVVKEVGKYSTGKVGCDAACGSGFFTRALKRAGYSVYGSDLSEEM
ncbi:MAG TPA: class I SAM-dependent methyltransferase, partial [Clostridiales bacterium]|nr:class I SAM-dependent methyltransferase [Clostridiales bacterium]